MQRRKEQEVTLTSEKSRKKKRRSAPLTGVSKLRKAANARERERVGILNDGIERLRSILPKDESNVKPTKTEIIWMAARYISELKDMLDENDSGLSSISEELDQTSPSSAGISVKECSDLSDLESLMNIDIDELLTVEEEQQILLWSDSYEL